MQYAGRRGGSSHGRWHRCCGRRPSIVSPGGDAGGQAPRGGAEIGPGLGLEAVSWAGWSGAQGRGGHLEWWHPALLGLRRGVGCCP